MPDVLLRNLAPNLKKNIEKNARASKRSLSDEIKHLVRVGLQKEHEDNTSGASLADVFRDAFADNQMSDDEHRRFSKSLEEHRKEQPRPVPEFE